MHMKKLSLFLTTLLFSIAAWAERPRLIPTGDENGNPAAPFSSCGVNTQETDPDQVVAIIKKSKDCRKACAIAHACGLGDNRDSARAYAAIEKCENSFAPHLAVGDKAYKSAITLCQKKMESALSPDEFGNPQGGTSALSAAAYCQMDAACYFHSLFQPYKL